MIQTISDTILYVAQERMKEATYQNLASALYQTLLEVSRLVGETMKESNTNARKNKALLQD